MKLGYTILAEALIRKRDYRGALKAAENLPKGKGKDIILDEIRNGSVKAGDIEIYQKTSRMRGLPDSDEIDLTAMFLINIDNQDLDVMVRILDMLPDSAAKGKLIDTAIIESANKGHIIICERLAEKRGRDLTKDEALLAKLIAVREGWIYDSERAAKIAGVEVTKQDYMTMFVANKDKGLLSEMLEIGERAGIELDPDSMSGLLLAAIQFNRETVWKIAEML